MTYIPGLAGDFFYPEIIGIAHAKKLIFALRLKIV